MTAGDVQWMTAGSGILHQEMPKGDATGACTASSCGPTCPPALKMTDPRYQDIPAERDSRGHRRRRHPRAHHLRRILGQAGPVEGVAADPRYVDISVPPGKRKRIKVETTRNAFAYVFAGSGTFRDCVATRRRF